jgi:hypothetical protein
MQQQTSSACEATVLPASKLLYKGKFITRSSSNTPNVNDDYFVSLIYCSMLHFLVHPPGMPKHHTHTVLQNPPNTHPVVSLTPLLLLMLQVHR